MARHVVTILFFTIGNLYIQVGTAYWILYRAGNTQMKVPDNDSAWVLVLKLIYVAQGFFLPLTRLSEPFFFHMVKQKVQKISCCSRSRSQEESKLERANDLTFLKRGIKADDLELRESEVSSDAEPSDGTATSFEPSQGREVQLEMEPLFLLLSSSLNVELVYIILKSITQFAYVEHSYRTGSSTSTTKKATTLEVDDATGDASLRLTRIKVKNSEEWQAKPVMKPILESSRVEE